MIDSMIEPQPVEGRGINTISQEGPGLQNKEEPDAGAALPDRDPNFECLEKDQVRTRTTEVLERRDCALDIKVWLAKRDPLGMGPLVTGGEGERGWFLSLYCHLLGHVAAHHLPWLGSGSG